MIRRIALVAFAAIILIVVAAAVYFRSASDDPAIWHVDPLTTERTGKPNDYLVAPEVDTAVPANRTTRTHAIAPRELMFLFHSVAMNAPRTKVVAGSVDELWVTYAQRSSIWGFPDYISARAVPVGDGSAMAVWSRARFGYGDMGVNETRVELWLAQIGEER